MPTPLVFDLPDYQTNEALKTFDSTDSLAKSYLDLDSKVKGGSLELLPEDLRKDPSVSKFKTVTEVAKSYVEAQKLLGTIKHAPVKIEEYRFTPMKDLHPGVAKGVESTQKFLATQLHALDIDNDRADKLQQAVVMGLHNALVEQDKQHEIKSKEVETSLRQEWGADYDKNKLNINNILTRLGATDLAATVANNPASLKAVGKIVSLLSEDSIGKLGEETHTSVDLKTAEGRMKALKEFNDEVLKQGSAHPFNDAKHKDHAETVKKYNSFFQEQNV